jgi:ATP-dependent DNA ligase
MSMTLVVRPPIAPMLARLTRELPSGALTYEPKWDGFRCLAFVDRGDDGVVDLRSRHDRPLARYFPEVVAGLMELIAPGGPTSPGLVLDGELVLASTGRARAGSRDDEPREAPDFAVLMSRLHPSANRVERLSREAPARYVAFDVLEAGGRDLRETPFVERRATLEHVLADAGRSPDDAAVVELTPATRDPEIARHWLNGGLGPGVDGVVAKPDGMAYEAGRRAMTKVKRLRSADCLLAGVRLAPGPLVSSLLLGLLDDQERLHHVGVVTQLPAGERRALLDELRPLAIPLDRHPWRDGFLIGASPLGRLKGSASRWTPEMEHDWLPLRPERVVEVGYDQVDGDRFRHPAKLLRWRPDREGGSCRLDQLLDPQPATSIAEQARSA